MELLEYDADMVAAEQRQGILIHVPIVRAGDAHVAAAHALKACDHHQHGRLARAGRPDDADRRPLLDGHIDTPQDVDRPGRPLQSKMDAVELDGSRID